MNPKEISPQAYKEVLEHVRNAPSPTLIKGISGTLAFFYYITLGYFFDYEKFKLAVRLINDV